MSRKSMVLLALGLAVAGGGGALWTLRQPPALPAGIVASNGRVEANQVEVSTKIAGRIVDIQAREGDMVEAGAVVARLDEAELAAQARQAQAQAEQARKALGSAVAAVASRKAELKFARQELKRSSDLAARGYSARETVDQRQQQVASAEAALAAAEAQVAESQAAIAAADAAVDRLRTLLADATLRSPVRGRVQYRLIEPGAVLAAGGRVVTLLNLTDIYMTVYLPAADAGRLRVGDEARVVLDAFPAYVFPVQVTFVASEAQFTPKTVETAAEREKLMFRVKLQASAEFLRTVEPQVKTGLRGMAYLRVDRTAVWPARLDVKLPQ